MVALGMFFSAILSKLVAMVVWVGALAVAAFVAMSDLGKDLFSWLFEQVLTVAVSAVSAVDSSGMNGFSASGWGSLPGELVNILGLLGVGTAMAIITAAIGIRLALQLIPFTRLGS